MIIVSTVMLSTYKLLMRLSSQCLWSTRAPSTGVQSWRIQPANLRSR